MYIGIYVQYLIFLSDFNYTWILSTDFRKILKCKISWNSDQWQLFYVEGQADDTKLIAAFRGFANALRNL